MLTAMECAFTTLKAHVKLLLNKAKERDLRQLLGAFLCDLLITSKQWNWPCAAVWILCLSLRSSDHVNWLYRKSNEIQARIQLFRQGGGSIMDLYTRNVALGLVNYWIYSQTPIGPYTLYARIHVHRLGLRLFHSKCNRPISKRLWS